MCALSHFLEREGIATALIGLIRVHVERMRPPRALAVPFELGRPLGAPNQPEFQRRVLTALLDLFKAPAGPVLVDFPEAAPATPEGGEMWVCPVSLSPPPPADTALDRLRAATEGEIARLEPWYGEAVRTRGRTTFGISGFAVMEIPGFLTAFAADTAMTSPRADVPITLLAKRAADDLRAFYYEAATAKPGAISDVGLGDWFWGETAAGQTLLALRRVCLGAEDPVVKQLGQLQLLPTHQRDKRT